MRKLTARLTPGALIALAAAALVGCGGIEPPQTEFSAAEFTGTSTELDCDRTGGASTRSTELYSRDVPRERIPIAGGDIVIEYSRPNRRPEEVKGVEMYGRKAPLYVTNGKSVRIRVDRSMQDSAALTYVPSTDGKAQPAENLRFTACPAVSETAKAFTGWPGAIFTRDAESCVQLVVDDGETIRARTLKFGRKSCP